MSYRLSRERGKARYFGNPNYPRCKTQYRTHWWRIDFSDGTWCLAGTRAEAVDYATNYVK